MSVRDSHDLEGIPVYVTVEKGGSPGSLNPLLDLLIKMGLDDLAAKKRQAAASESPPEPTRPTRKRRKK